MDEVFIAGDTFNGDFQASLLLKRATKAEVFGSRCNDHYACGGEEGAIFSRVFGNVAVLRSSPCAKEDERGCFGVFRWRRRPELVTQRLRLVFPY